MKWGNEGFAFSLHHLCITFANYWHHLCILSVHVTVFAKDNIQEVGEADGLPCAASDWTLESPLEMEKPLEPDKAPEKVPAAGGNEGIEEDKQSAKKSQR